MPALNEHQLTTLKRLLCASYEHVHACIRRSRRMRSVDAGQYPRPLLSSSSPLRAFPFLRRIAPSCCGDGYQVQVASRYASSRVFVDSEPPLSLKLIG
jgi:hypothetical protein